MKTWPLAISLQHCLLSPLQGLNKACTQAYLCFPAKTNRWSHTGYYNVQQCEQVVVSAIFVTRPNSGREHFVIASHSGSKTLHGYHLIHPHKKSLDECGKCPSNSMHWKVNIEWMWSPHSAVSNIMMGLFRKCKVGLTCVPPFLFYWDG